MEMGLQSITHRHTSGWRRCCTCPHMCSISSNLYKVRKKNFATFFLHLSPCHTHSFIIKHTHFRQRGILTWQKATEWQRLMLIRIWESGKAKTEWVCAIPTREFIQTDTHAASSPPPPCSHIHTTRSPPCSTQACNEKQVDSYTAGNIPCLQPRCLFRMHLVSKRWQRVGHASEDNRMRNFGVPPHHPGDAVKAHTHKQNPRCASKIPCHQEWKLKAAHTSVI